MKSGKLIRQLTALTAIVATFALFNGCLWMLLTGSGMVSCKKSMEQQEDFLY